MMQRWTSLLIGGLLLLGGCTLAPHYERPPAPIPTGWPEGEAYACLLYTSDAADERG